MSKEAALYRGPTGTTIDWRAACEEMEARGLLFEMHRNSDRASSPPGAEDHFKIMRSEDDPSWAAVSRSGFGVARESFPFHERVEGVARLLRRVLPDPDKVIGYMSDEQAADFIGDLVETRA